MRLLLAFLLAAGTALAQLPDPVLPASMGINVHFLHHGEKDLDQIAAAGFRVVRRDFTWTETEKAKGAYDFSAYDYLTAELAKRGLRGMYLLCYSNPLYEANDASPQHPESIEAFAKWAAAAAAHFHGQKVIWEIWNEPNIAFWKPKPDPIQYAALALATAKQMRAADPAATIMAPGAAGFPYDFLEPLFKTGVLQYLDAVSVHPYKDTPEMVAPDYAKLRELINRYSRGKNVAIVSSEWGHSTFQGWGSVKPDVQAQYLVREQLWNLACGIPLSVWFSWKDMGTSESEREHNFGLVTTNGTPKPGLAALQAMTQELAGYRFVRRLEVATKKEYVLLFRNAQNLQKIAIWTVGEPRKLRLPGSSRDLQISGAPQYVVPQGMSL